MNIDEPMRMGQSTVTFISAIVLNWHDTERTLACLRSLAAENDFDEIIVVDNESNGHLKASVGVLRDDRIRIIESAANLGFSAGINLGLRSRNVSKSSYSFIINNDAELTSGSLTRLIEAAENHGAGGVYAPVILNPDGSIQSKGEKLNRITLKVTAVTGQEVPDFLTWACVLLPTAVLEEIGYLDESFFMYWEDVDYGIRCSRAGIQQVVVQGATVTHELSASHGSASSWIHLYSILGVVILARKLRGATYIGAAWRLGLRLAKRVLLGDRSGAAAVIQGARMGLLRRGRPAHELVAELRAIPKSP